MEKFRHCILSTLSLAAALVSACSTTRVLAEGEYRLTANSVSVEGEGKVSEKEVDKYIRQKPNGYFLLGWNPFLNVYNLSGKNESSFGSRIARSLGVAPVVFDENLMESSVENIQGHLNYIGYYGSDVTAQVSYKKKRAYVDYSITLGKRYPIGNINISLPQNAEFIADFQADSSSMTIKSGDWLSEEALEAETVRSSAYFREQGYYGFTKNYYFFEADTLLGTGTADLSMSIREYTRNETPSEAIPLRKRFFGEVGISYPQSLKIRDKVLCNMNTVRPGNLYKESTVNNTYNRLSALSLFSSVNMELTASDSTSVDCEISLTPARLQGYKANLEASSNSSGLLGISPELSYYHKNIFRGGEWLNLSFSGDFQFKPNSDVSSTEFGTSVSLSLPRFLGLTMSRFQGGNVPRTEFKASYNYQNRPEYVRNVLSVSYGYSGSFRNALFYQIYPLKLDIVRLYNMDESFYDSLSSNPFLRNAYQNHFDLGSSVILYYTTDPSSNPQGSYKFARLGLDLSGNVLSLFKGLMGKDEDGSGTIWGTPYAQYIRAELSAGRCWRFGRNLGQALATRVLAGAGYAYGNSSALPFEQHFYSGGASSLRGWQARSVGPGLSKENESFSIPNQTGDMKLEANLEYRFAMFWKLHGAAFVDVGNVWTYDTDSDEEDNSSSQFHWSSFVESLAANWGVGVRMDLNFILLRLDLGMVVHDPSQDSGQRWRAPSKWLKHDGYAVHFGVGYPF